MRRASLSLSTWLLTAYYEVYTANDTYALASSLWQAACKRANMMHAMLQRCLIMCGCFLGNPRALIMRYGGVDRMAIITGFTDHRHRRALCYQYTDALVNGTFAASTLAKLREPQQKAEAFRHMVHGTWDRRYTGIIQTDWDVQDILLHGGDMPRWCQRYHAGYTFPIRYLTRNPAIHYVLESFEFDH
jgi:hypothetical protein